MKGLHLNPVASMTLPPEAPAIPVGLRRLFRRVFTRRVLERARLDAAPFEVWRWMTDFASFPSWNPLLRKVEGTLHIGATLDVRARLGRRVIHLRPLVTSAEPARELRWRTRVLVPGLFDVDRRFILDASGSQQTTLIQDETSTGLLVPFAYALAHMDRDLRAGFRDFSQALALQTAAARQRCTLLSDVRALQPRSTAASAGPGVGKSAASAAGAAASEAGVRADASGAAAVRDADAAAAAASSERVRR